MHWQFGEMEFGEMKRNTSNWSNFGMLLRRAGLTVSAGLSCYTKSVTSNTKSSFNVPYSIVVQLTSRWYASKMPDEFNSQNADKC